MRKLLSWLVALSFAMPLWAAQETWKHVSIVDGKCASDVKADPDKHTTKCMLQCQKEGYGVLMSDGTYVKFDEEGNKKVLTALKATKKKNHLRATVVGEKTEGVIKLERIALD